MHIHDELSPNYWLKW